MSARRACLSCLPCAAPRDVWPAPPRRGACPAPPGADLSLGARPMSPAAGWRAGRRPSRTLPAMARPRPRVPAWLPESRGAASRGCCTGCGSCGIWRRVAVGCRTL